MVENDVLLLVGYDCNKSIGYDELVCIGNNCICVVKFNDILLVGGVKSDSVIGIYLIEVGV